MCRLPWRTKAAGGAPRERARGTRVTPAHLRREALRAGAATAAAMRAHSAIHWRHRDLLPCVLLPAAVDLPLTSRRPERGSTHQLPCKAATGSRAVAQTADSMQVSSQLHTGAVTPPCRAAGWRGRKRCQGWGGAWPSGEGPKYSSCGLWLVCARLQPATVAQHRRPFSGDRVDRGVVRGRRAARQLVRQGRSGAGARGRGTCVGRRRQRWGGESGCGGASCGVSTSP